MNTLNTPLRVERNLIYDAAGELLAEAVSAKAAIAIVTFVNATAAQ